MGVPGESDPYSLDPAELRRAAQAHPIDPAFDVQDRRGMLVIMLLRSRMVDGRELETLRQDLIDYVSKMHGAKVILDMQAVHHMSSAALGLLLSLKTTIEGNGGAICLCNVRDDLKQIFKIMKLQRVLPIKESVDAAAASF